MNTTKMDSKHLYDQHVLGNYPVAPLTLTKGQGSRLWDDEGNEYLDFSTGIAVNTLGHGHPHWVRRVSEQAAQMAHCSNLYRNPNQALLAEKLTSLAGPGKVFFCTSGAEANESLIKLARLFGRDTTGVEGKRYQVLTAKESFHGRTFGGMAATPQDKIQKGFAPMLDGFAHGEIDNLESFEALITDKTAAILLEPILGEGGILPCSDQFLRGIRNLCNQRGLMLLLDEVQSGCGRTGRFFAHQHTGIRPDAIAMAKGLGNGFPLGAVWVDRRHSTLFTPGSHGSTFGGSPLACAAALATLEVMEKENLMEKVARQGADFKQSLEKLAQRHLDKIREVRGIGFLLALGLVGDPGPLLTSLREKGLLAVGAGRNAVRFLPPLNIEEADLEAGLEIIESALNEL